jgi:hypothetical protein
MILSIFWERYSDIKRVELSIMGDNEWIYNKCL